MKFKIGDRVRAICSSEVYRYTNEENAWCGVVVVIEDNEHFLARTTHFKRGNLRNVVMDGLQEEYFEIDAEPSGVVRRELALV